jgi:protein TonB
MSGPPPPAIAPVVPPPAKTTPPPAVAPVQSIEAARESASHVGGSFAQPELVFKVNPVYPAAALQRKAEGTVRFQATIAKDGSVKNVQLLSGDPLLNTAARRAVLQWKYRPATLNGTPTEVTQAIVVKFSLSNK